MKKSVPREYFESLVIAVILALFVRTWVFQAFKIPTGSMEKNLLVGDHLIVNKMIFAPSANGLERAMMPSRPIRRGDVIVFKYPKEPDRDFVKRVIGVPGDRLELHRKVVSINGQPIQEPYIQLLSPPAAGAPQTDDLREEYGPVQVPPGQYFMMGDNRDNSEDSRYWGFMPEHYVKGQAMFIYYSVDGGGDSLAAFFTSIQWNRLFNRVR